MEVGLRLPLGPDLGSLVEIARAAEGLGCDSVWVSDHLVWPAKVESRYPFGVAGELPLPPETPFYDALITLAAIAVATNRIRLATGVFILPLRETLATARAVATLDSLSAGRVIFGVGLGWMEEEFIAAGQQFSSRGLRNDEMIESLRLLWSGGVHGYRGRVVQIPPVHLEPSPPQGGLLPIHIGGESRWALDRAARLGDGWISMQQTPGSAGQRLREIGALRDSHGRLADPFETSVLVPWPLSPEVLSEYQDVGVTRALVYPWRSERWRDDLDELGHALSRYRVG